MTPTSAEERLRKALVGEFKQSLAPTPADLLRHCENYAVELFDAAAGQVSESERTWVHLHKVALGITRYIFCFDGPWQRAVEYCMLAVLDHGPNPPSTQGDLNERTEGFLRRYLALPEQHQFQDAGPVLVQGRTSDDGDDGVKLEFLDVQHSVTGGLEATGCNGELFISYALSERVEYWTSCSPLPADRAETAIVDTCKSEITPDAAIGESTTANQPESMQEKATRRRAVIDPLLKSKGWTTYRWEQEAEVPSKVGARYRNGETNLRPGSRLKLSSVLGIGIDALPQ
jgi:hypothetical protein